MRVFAAAAGWIVQTPASAVSHARAVVDVSVQPPVVRRADDTFPCKDL